MTFVIQTSLPTNKRVYAPFKEFNENAKKSLVTILEKRRVEIDSDAFFNSIINIDDYYTHIDNAMRENDLLHAENDIDIKNDEKQSKKAKY